MYLDNIQDSLREIFDFGYEDTIRCYDTLYNDNGTIFSDMEYKVVETFKEFKIVLDNLILNYKELKIQNKMNQIEKNF